MLNKNYGSGLSNPSWKKCSLAVRRGALHCEMGRKKKCLNLMNCHLAISYSWVGYHTSFQRGESGLSADEKKLENFPSGMYF